MNMDKKRKSSEEIIHSLTVRREAPKFTIIFPIILYIVLYRLTTAAAELDQVLMICRHCLSRLQKPL